MSNPIHICVTADRLSRDWTVDPIIAYDYEIVAIVGGIYTARRWRGIPVRDAIRMALFERAVHEMIEEHHDIRETQRHWNERGVVG